jgi:hypothetical protein
MRRLRAGVELTIAVMRDPRRLIGLSDSEWEDFLAVAQETRLLSRVALERKRSRLTLDAPDWARDRLEAAAVKGAQYEREIGWEIGRIQRALRDVDIDPVFLKGAAYVAARIPCGRGRVVADIDILVEEAALADVERALVAHGWEFEPLEPYDDRYYREWMHELPPMRHRQRGTLLDVHHRILPRTGRMHPPTARLLERSVAIDGVRVLSPPHRLLHASAHLFQDGEVFGSLRDLADIASLSAGGEAFWREVAEEAQALGLGRPLFYAVRYARRMGLADELAPSTLGLVGRWAPPPATQALMDTLVHAALGGGALLQGPASGLLLMRSQWLRMPPSLLAAHLWSKIRRSSPFAS